MKTSRYFYLPRVLIVIALLISQNGCKKNKDEITPDDSQTNVVPETTKVITDQDWNKNIISVDSSTWTLTFSSALTDNYDFKTGDVLISTEGEGLLRKITNIRNEGDHLVITTEEATVTDAVPSGRTNFNVDLTQNLDKAKILYLAEGVSFNGVKRTDDDRIDLVFSLEKEIYDNVTVGGELTLSPSISGKISWHEKHLDTLKLAYTMSENLELTSTVEIASLELEKDVKIAKVELPTFTIYAGVPIVITPVFTLKIGVSLELNSEITLGVKQELSFTTGFSYIDGDVAPICEMEKHLAPMPPELSNTLEAKAYIKPQLDMKIYQVISPNLSLEMYGKLEAELGTTPWWTLYGGLAGEAGFKIGKWGFDIVDIKVDLFDYKIPLANANGDINFPPEAGFTVTPESGGIGTIFHFDASESTDEEDDVEDLQVRWDWENDGVWDTEYTKVKQAAHSYSEPGNYTVRLEVKDKDGATGRKTGNIIVTSNHAPVAVINVEPGSGAIGTEFVFDPTSSHDDEDPLEALDFRWDWEDDGTWDTDFEPYYVEQTHIYDEPGEHTVRLQARDGQYATGETTKTLTVVNSYAPVADFTITPGSGTVDTTFTLDASASYDNEDPPEMLEVRWNWDQDPDWDTEWTTNKIEQHKFSFPGTYTIQLIVRDNDGYTNVISKNFSIGESSGIVCPGIPTITYGGKVYHTVLIGDQCWLKENLDIGTMIEDEPQSDNGIIEKYCYDDDPYYCDLYGGLYLWDEMMQYTEEESTQGICPPGWHVPSDDEWKVLEGTVDSQYGVGDPEWDATMLRGYDAGINLKSKSGWYQNNDGADTKGFSARPGGLFHMYNGDHTYSYANEWARWWTSTKEDSQSAYARTIRYYAGGVYRDATSRTDLGHSVRCIKDD
jgi:uncharacterized protein (TIGR02145 family)